MPILRPSESEKNLQQAFSGLTSPPGGSHSQGSLRTSAMEYFWKDAQRDFFLGKIMECRSPKGGGGEIFIIVHITPIQKNNHIIGVTPLLPLIRFPYWPLLWRLSPQTASLGWATWPPFLLSGSSPAWSLSRYPLSLLRRVEGESRRAELS